MAEGFTLPNSSTFESIFIGILLFDKTSPSLRSQLLETLTEEDFYNKKWLLIFQHFKNYLSSLSTPIAYNLKDFVSNYLLGKGLFRNGKEVCDFLENLRQLAEDTPSEELYEAYLNELKKFTQKRKVILLSEETSKKAYSQEQDINQVVEFNLNSMNEINNKNSIDLNFTTGEEECNKLLILFNDFGDTMSNKLIIPSCLTQLDELIKGFKANELSIIAARPSCGKTALATTIMLNMLSNPCPIIVERNGKFEKTQKQIKIAFFSLEMDKDSIVRRFLSSYSFIPATYIFGTKSIRDTKYIERMRGSQESLTKILQNLILYDKSGLTIVKLKTLARKIKQEKNIDIIFIDYLTLIKVDSSKNKEEWQSIGEISSQLKELAKELEIPIVVLSQLNREAEDTEPKLSNLRNSGAIEQDADLVILLHDPLRNAKNNINQRVLYHFGDNSYTSLNARTIKCKVSKQRNGMTGSFNLKFLTDYVRFVNEEDCTIEDNVNIDSSGVKKC